MRRELTERLTDAAVKGASLGLGITVALLVIALLGGTVVNNTVLGSLVADYLRTKQAYQAIAEQANHGEQVYQLVVKQQQQQQQAPRPAPPK